MELHQLTAEEIRGFEPSKLKETEGEIRQALHRALVYRVRAPISRMGERKAADWTDLDDTLVRETLANVARWEVLP